MAKSILKLPWMKFFPGDWRKDPNLGMCSPATRGIWFDFLCAMHESGRTGVLEGSITQLSRIARCSETEVQTALDELRVTKTAHVTLGDGHVTLVNRRMQREHKERTGSTLRMRTLRMKRSCNAPVTPYMSDVRDQRSDSTSNTHTLPSLENVKSRAAFVGCSVEEAERFWNHYEATGWIDKNGNRIVNWQAKMASWCANNRANNGQVASAKSDPMPPRNDFWKNSKQLEQIDTEIKAIEARASHTATAMVVELKDRKRYDALRSKRKELKKTLGL